MTIGKLAAGLGLAMLMTMAPGNARADICSSDLSNIVQNCGFETGNFMDWTANPASSDPWAVTSSTPNSGTYAASTGCVGPQCINGTPAQQASLAQVLATNAGDTYTLQFAFASAGEPGQELQVLWDGSVVQDSVNLPATGYVDYSIAGLVGTGSDTLEFLARQDPGFNRLDDVQVDDTGVSAAPEPASLLLLGSGLLACLGMARRRKA